MAGHIVIGALHSTERLLLHAGIFAPVLFLLFRRRASVLFRGASPVGPPVGNLGDSKGG